MKTDRNYAQFYALLKKMEGENKEEIKMQLVDQYTGGRTISLRAMTDREYRTMIKRMEDLTTDKERLRELRSQTLDILGKLGVNTRSWDDINSFCSDPRIAGKVFAKITISEHEALRGKLRSMLGKGYKRAKPSPIVALPNPNNTPS